MIGPVVAMGRPVVVGTSIAPVVGASAVFGIAFDVARAVVAAGIVCFAGARFVAPILRAGEIRMLGEPVHIRFDAPAGLGEDIAEVNGKAAERRDGVAGALRRVNGVGVTLRLECDLVHCSSQWCGRVYDGTLACKGYASRLRDKTD